MLFNSFEFIFLFLPVDGTTSRNILQFNSKENIRFKAKRIARYNEGQYKNMSELHPSSVEFFNDIKKNNDIYSKWINYLKVQESSNVRIVDFSYPRSTEKGISAKMISGITAPTLATMPEKLF